MPRTSKGRYIVRRLSADDRSCQSQVRLAGLAFITPQVRSARCRDLPTDARQGSASVTADNRTVQFWGVLPPIHAYTERCGRLIPVWMSWSREYQRSVPLPAQAVTEVHTLCWAI